MTKRITPSVYTVPELTRERERALVVKLGVYLVALVLLSLLFGGCASSRPEIPAPTPWRLDVDSCYVGCDIATGEAGEHLPPMSFRSALDACYARCEGLVY